MTGKSVRESRDALSRLLDEQSEHWYEQRNSLAGQELHSFLLCKAKDRMFWLAGELLRGVEISRETTVEEFFTEALFLLHRYPYWRTDEDWPQDVYEPALAEVMRFIFEQVPAECRRTYEAVMAARTATIVYVLYSAGDGRTVESIGEILRHQGRTIELLDGDSPGVAETHTAVLHAIQEARILCLCLSAASIGSQWLQHELLPALRAGALSGVSIMRLALDDSELPASLPPASSAIVRLGSGPDALRRLGRELGRALDASIAAR